jgi:serine carboxypeptidase 1
MNGLDDLLPILQLSWGPLLYQVSRVDEKGLQQCNSVAAKIKEQLEKGQFADAEASWSELEGVVLASSNSVVRTRAPYIPP